MKIAIFTDVFLPKIDGVVTSLEQLILEFDRQGHEVLVFAPQTKGAPKKIGKRIQIFYLPSIPAFVYPEFRLGLLSPSLNKAFKSFHPDVVQIVTPANVGMMGVFLSKKYDVPVVGVFHGYFMKPEYLQIVGIKRGAKFVESIGWKFMKFVFNPCKILISPSESVKQDLVDHDVPNPIEICPNGLKTYTESFESSAHEKFKKKYKINPEETFLYVGRLSKEKSIDVLIKHFYDLHRSHSEARLLIVGDGPVKTELEHLVQLYDIENQVTFLGAIRHDELFRIGIFTLGCAFVTCSTSEVQPMSVIEAQMSGLPVIGMKSQGMIDLIQDGENGYLADPDTDEYVEKMKAILSDKKKRKEMSKKSVEMSQKFTIENAAKCYISVFEKVMKS